MHCARCNCSRLSDGVNLGVIYYISDSITKIDDTVNKIYDDTLRRIPPITCGTCATLLAPYAEHSIDAKCSFPQSPRPNTVLVLLSPRKTAGRILKRAKNSSREALPEKKFSALNSI